MDDIDIEPPEAPVLNTAQPSAETDDVPLPPPQLQRKLGFFKTLFSKKEPKQKEFKEALLPPLPPQLLKSTTDDSPSTNSLPTINSPPSIPKSSSFEDMATPEPPEPAGPQDELLPLPDVGNLYEEHAKDLEQLKKKLGEEFVVPKDEEKSQVFNIELNEAPTIGEILRQRKEKPAEQVEIDIPLSEDASPKIKTTQITSTPLLPEQPEEDTPPLPDFEETPLSILGMKGKVEKKKVTIETIATQPNPFKAFKEQEKILQSTPELPSPLPQNKTLNEEEVKQIIKGVQAGSYGKFNAATNAYLNSLEAELKEIVKSPFAKQKQGKSPNSRLFFKLHKASNTGELIKLLKTIEFVDKVDLNTLTIKNGKDIEEWLSRFIKAERMKEDHALLEQQLSAIFDAAFQEFKKNLEHEKLELDHLSATLLKEKERTESHKQELTNHREELLRDKENHESLVDAKVKVIQAELAKKELAIRKEYDTKFQKLSKDKEEFDRLKKKQDLDIYAELQRIEKIKLSVEAEEMDIEEERRALENDKKAYQAEKKNADETSKKQLADMRIEEKQLQKSIVDSRVRLERLQKDFDDRIKKQYFTMSNNLAKEKQSFQEFRDKELDRLNNIRSALEREKTDIFTIKDELSRQEARIKAILSDQKTQIKTDLDEMRKIDSNLEQVEVNIRRQKEALEQEGFHKYLQAKLQEVNPGSTEHVEIAHTLVEEHELEKALYKDINDLVEECKRLLSERKLSQAKALYNTIRQRYANSDLNKNEKSILYNQIRELYDDIHLQDL